MVWIVASVIALVIIIFAITYLSPPERTGKTLLKRKCQELGIDIKAIPEEAWDEIVSHKIKAAKAMASLSSRSVDKNWRANLVRQIDNESLLMKHILLENNAPMASSTQEILIKYNIVKQ